MVKKSFNEKLNDSKDMPKIVTVDDEKSIERYGGKHMLIAPPLDYNSLMSEIPEGKVITITQIRQYLAEKYDAPADVIQQDVADFLEELIAKKVVLPA